ncbi:MAG: DUF4270 family protein [Chitinophagaceae bacterium]
MKNKHVALTLGAIITSIIILFSCRKINEATELGGGLIPPVDNINTFDTTLDVQVFNDSFTVVNDSTVAFPGFEHFVGQINNDPFLGKTNAQLFFELKPSTYRFTFADKPDSLHIDSVVLVLDYTGTYGDSTVPQTINVYEVGGQITDFRYDTAYRYRENTIPKAGLLGFRTFMPRDLNDSVKAYQDTTSKQLRIRLADAFGDRLLNYDTTGSTGAYTSDSNFRKNFKGFALESVSGGNAIMGFNLAGANTKLAIYYRYDNGPTDFDTTVNYFTFTDFSANANAVRRDYSGTPFAASVNGTVGPPDNFAYIQATPGTFATIKIPSLAGLSNRIVHRAELIMEEAFHVSDSLFPPPPRLYLDAYDPATSKYRTIPYDFLLDASSNSNNISSFGGLPFRALDNLGNSVYTWHFNLSRYVQHVVNGTELAYDFRLTAPAYIDEDYGTSTAGSVKRRVYINAAFDSNLGSGIPVWGRVRLYGGDPTQVNPHRMRLRIVYSKL